jgi:hypothetical protein
MTAHPRCAVVLLALLLSHLTLAQPAADDPNHAYLNHGQKLLHELGQHGPHNAYCRAN